MSNAPQAAMCQHNVELVVHRGSVDRHTWPGQEESTCNCQPLIMCPVCYTSEIRQHAFILGEASWFRGYSVKDGQPVN